MLEYTEFEKEKLGKSFQYYRKKQHIKWKNIQERSLFSQTTLSKMQKGSILKNQTYYDDLLELLNLDYRRIKGFEERLDEYLLKLSQVLEIYDNKQIEKLYLEMENSLKDFSNTPIYEQYYLALSHIFRYYREGRYLTLEEINTDILLIESDFFEKELTVYLLEVMFISNNNAIAEISIREKIIELAQPYKDEIILYYIFGIAEKCNTHYHTALDYFQKYYQYWKEKKNTYRELKGMIACFVIYMNIDVSKAEQMIPCLLEYLDDEIPTTTKRSILYNVSMYYFVNKQYEKAYPLFVTIAHHYLEESDKVVLVYIGYICTRLNQDIPDFILDADLSKYHNRVYVDFYCLKKQKVEPKVLVDFIMKKIVHEKLMSIPYKRPFWEMYEYELLMIATEHKKYYKAYLKYREKMEKICKYD